MTIKNLSKTYGSKTVLDNINLAFKSGKVYGIVGANGAGKTTLFKCISHLTDYLGTIDSEVEDFRNQIGYLVTSPYTLNRISGKEYLQLFALSREDSSKQIQESNLFNLPLDQYISTYSTGMLKKLALQAVLLQKNEIIILDEPFNGVDIQSNMVIIEIIKTLKEKGKLILIASHIFETLDKLCDKIYLLENHRIANSFEKAEFSILEKKLYSYIVKEDIKAYDF